MPKSNLTRRPTPPRRLAEKTYEAYELLKSGKPLEALEILLELDHEYPNTPEVLANLINAYFDLQDHLAYEQAIYRMAHLQPHSPDLQYALAGAHMVNMRPALALRCFHDALRRWPSHPHADEARKQIQILEDAVRQQISQTDLEYDKGLSLVSQHDEMSYHQSHYDLRQARLSGEKLLREFPTYAPAINNLSQVEAMDGRLDKAIQLSSRALEFDTTNIHALSNLTRLYFLAGNPDQAYINANLLKSSTSSSVDRWIKIAEALTFLEDDQGVLDLYNHAHDHQALEKVTSAAIFFHLLAVAAYNLGREAEARSFWEKSLAIDADLTWARENFNDLARLPAERSGAWAFGFESWLLTPMALEVAEQIKRLQRSPKKAEMQAAIKRIIEEKYSRVLFLAPHMVARGDPKTCEFVTHMAAVSAHPHLLSAAKSYIFGKRGTFQARFKNAQMLAQAELIPSGALKLWDGDLIHEVMLLNIEVSPQAEPSKLPNKALTLFEQAFYALQKQDGKTAQDFLEKALAIAPDDPSLINNLAMAYDLQGKSEQARLMVIDLHDRFPEYFFGSIAVAGIEIERGNLDRAHQILNSLIQRKKVHTSEFLALCKSQIHLSMLEGDRDAGRMWVDVWQQVDPENPDAAAYRLRINTD
jgi:tetratricopeptide (TPR) repeat protein